MRRPICFLSIFSFFVISAQAFQSGSTLAMEPFAGPSGALNATSGGSGWAGPWQVQNSSTAIPGYNISTSTPPTYSGISQSGGYAIGGVGYQWAGRQLDTSSGGAFSQYLNNGMIGQS